MTQQPDMAKVRAAVRYYTGYESTRLRSARSYQPKQTPADAGLRKEIKSVRRGCSGFCHPHFHQ